MAARQPLGDVVVLLPGILGSVLQRDGKDVWAPTPGAVGRGLWTLGRSVRSLELTTIRGRSTTSATASRRPA